MDKATVEEVPTNHGTVQYRINHPDRTYWYRDGLLIYALHDDIVTHEVTNLRMRRRLVAYLRRETRRDLPFYESNRDVLDEKGPVAL